MSIINTSLTTIASNIQVSSGNTAISAMYFCNYGATATTFNLYAVPNGSTVGTNSQIYYNIQVAAGDTFVADWEKLILGNGDTLRANASANAAITATISYIGV